MFWIFIAVAALAGGAVCWLICRNAGSAEKATLLERLRSRDEQVSELRALQEENARLRAVEAGLNARLEELAGAREQLSQAFQALSSDALKSNNQQFLQLAESTLARFHATASGDLEKRQTAIDELVKPIKESLAKVDQKIQQIEIARTGAYSSLTEQVKSMAAAQEELRRETGKLVGALRSPVARGRWGEIQLRRVVEMAGMLAYCDFAEQPSVMTADGRLRPDLIVRLPNQKQIVVDAKTPLTAYLAALDEPNETARAAKMCEHAQQVRKHLEGLGAKAYWAQFKPAPEFAVAFLPGEIFFSAALQHDPELIEFGVRNNVILATPTTLIALLKAVAYGWRQEQIAESAEEIRTLGAVLYERIRIFAGHYSDVGKNLGRAVQAYTRGKNSLESRLTSAARRFQELGAHTPAPLDEIYSINEVEASMVEGEAEKREATAAN